jgi:hypothetical protein
VRSGTNYFPRGEPSRLRRKSSTKRLPNGGAALVPSPTSDPKERARERARRCPLPRLPPGKAQPFRCARVTRRAIIEAPCVYAPRPIPSSRCPSLHRSDSP